MQRWLAFVQGDDSVKRPGPIKNDNLLVSKQKEKRKGGGTRVLRTWVGAVYQVHRSGRRATIFAFSGLFVFSLGAERPG